LTEEKKPTQAAQKKKSSKSWMLWAAFAVFIVGSIVFMFVIDSIYAPNEESTAAQPGAEANQ
jgi:bacteriorhodopsin